MFSQTSRIAAKDFISKRKSFCFPALMLAVCASTGWAQAPAVVVDAQQTIGTIPQGAQGIAVSKNGTVFIADTNNNQVLALNPKTGLSTAVATGGITLTLPTPLALDANGDLFVGDTPSGVGRIVELTGDGTGNLTGAASTYFAGAPLTNPFALTVDSAGTLFIGDYPLATGNGVIYSLAAGSTTLTALSFPGIPTQFTPGSLFRAGTNLYIADNGAGATGIGGVYVAPATGGTAQKIQTYTFTITNPTGIKLDAAGNIYILTYLTTGSGYNSGQQVVIVPAASPTSPYILPNSGILYGTDMSFDTVGNLDVLDYAGGTVVQLSSNPVGVGNKINVGGTGSPVQFNFEFNQGTTLRGFQVVTQGDVSQELTQSSGGTCANGKHTNLGPGGPTISNFYPYTCLENFSGTPTYPGLRTAAIQVKGLNGTILASTPVYETGLAGAEITYPVNERTTATDLENVQDIKVSGLDKTVYVSDIAAGQVYSIAGLGGSTLTPVSTGSITLSAPSGLALDGAGNLFIADFGGAQVVEVPTTTGLSPSVVNTGGLLQNPLSITVDFLGNTYIGDAGPQGYNASYANPGYLVKIPVGGAPYIMTIPSVQVVFPQSLAIDPMTGALVIGDGGDATTGLGQVVVVSADGTTANVKPIDGVTSPTGLAFDPAEELYVADQYANTITVVPPTGDSHLVIFNNSGLTQTLALGISAGGESFLLANYGFGSDNLVLLNGTRSTLTFGGVKIGNQKNLTATEYNIGNLPLTFGSPYYTTNGANAEFSVLGSTTCGDGVVLASATPCDINVQFTPVTLGQTTQQLTVQSDGYNGGSGAIAAPILTLRGTGDAPPSKKKR